MLESHPLYGIERIQRLAVLGFDRHRWYDYAQLEIVSICANEGWDVVEFTRKLAILSPKISIRRNVRATLALVGQGVYFSDVMRNVRRSMDIYSETGKIGGNKVPYFARALLGDRDSVTLDTWMSYALLKTKKPSVHEFRRKATKRDATALVTKVGKRLGLCPRDCQAAIWSGIFRDSGSEPEWFPIREEYDRWLAYDRQFPSNGNIAVPTIELDTSFNVEDFQF